MLPHVNFHVRVKVNTVLLLEKKKESHSTT